VKKLIITTSISLIVSILIAGCSSSETTIEGVGGTIPNTDLTDDLPGLIVTGLNGNTAQSVTSELLVSLSTWRTEPFETSRSLADAIIVPYTDGLNLKTAIDFYAPKFSECKILIGDSNGSGGGGSNDSPTNLDVGSTISINTPSGVWATLTNNGESSPVYKVSSLPAVVPNMATLNIPANNAIPTLKP